MRRPAVFLASNDARMITGTDLRVDADAIAPPVAWDASAPYSMPLHRNAPIRPYGEYRKRGISRHPSSMIARGSTALSGEVGQMSAIGTEEMINLEWQLVGLLG